MHTLLTFNNTTHTIHHPRGRYKRTIHTPADDTSGRYIHSSGRYRRTIHTLQRTIHANSLIRYRYTREILGRQFSCAGGPYGGNVGFLYQVGPRRKRFFKGSEASPKNTPGKARRKRTFRRLERLRPRQGGCRRVCLGWRKLKMGQAIARRPKRRGQFLAAHFVEPRLIAAPRSSSPQLMPPVSPGPAAVFYVMSIPTLPLVLPS